MCAALCSAAAARARVWIGLEWAVCVCGYVCVPAFVGECVLRVWLYVRSSWVSVRECVGGGMGFVCVYVCV